MLIAVLALFLGLADAHTEVVDVLASAAAALSENNGPGFLKQFDKAMPGYGRLQTDVEALLAGSEVSCSVDVLRDEGDEQKRSVAVDWSVRVHPKSATGQMIDREETLELELTKAGSKWKITGVSKTRLFAPAE